MQDGMTQDENDQCRRWVRAATAPRWQRALWGRDVYEPHLRTWRALRAATAVLALAICAGTAFLPMVVRPLFAVYFAVGVSAIVVRWRAVSRWEREHGR